jgi:hypothetical protein
LTINEFVDQLEDFSSWDGRKQVDYLAFFLIALVGQPSFSAREIAESFEVLSLKPYSRVAPYLSENAHRGRGGKYVKVGREYSLERSLLNEIRTRVEHEPKRLHVSKQLSDLLGRVGDAQEQTFLEEAKNCYRVGAFRAAIIMVWIVVVHHLQKFVLNDAKALAAFNDALSKNPDKRVRIVVKGDDFSELQESRFIELMRSAGLISNDVRKILDEKLGTRNSAAHPSGLVFDGHKATEFSSDLVQNVLLKF